MKKAGAALLTLFFLIIVPVSASGTTPRTPPPSLSSLPGQYYVLNVTANVSGWWWTAVDLPAAAGYRIFAENGTEIAICLLYTSPSPRDRG